MERDALTMTDRGVRTSGQLRLRTAKYSDFVQSRHVRLHHQWSPPRWRLCYIPPPMRSQARATRRWSRRQVSHGLRNKSSSTSETRVYSIATTLSQDEVNIDEKTRRVEGRLRPLHFRLILSSRMLLTFSP